MVLIALAEIGIRVTWWTVKGVYSVGKYLIYGKEKTDQDKIAELQTQLKEVQEKLKEKEDGNGEANENGGTKDEVKNEVNNQVKGEENGEAK